MRSARLGMLIAVLALAATAALAQTCPPVTTTCPGQAVSMQPSFTYPAGIGAGPVPQLSCLTGTDFDKAYLESMYQHHFDVLTLASLGDTQLSDKNLRDLSGKIVKEQIMDNQKLSLWHRDMGLGKIPVNFDRVQFDVNRLSELTGPQFDIEYARTMINYLQQQKDAGQLGMTQATRPEIRDQSKIVADAATNEIDALQRWLSEHTAPASVPPVACPS